MSAWTIDKRVPACGSCGHEFADGEALWSLLAIDEEGLSRRDRCAACRSDDELDAALFWWKTRHREAKQKGLQLDLEAIEALFLALGETTEPSAPSGDELELAEPEPGLDPDVARARAEAAAASEARRLERLRQLRYLMCLILLRKRRVKVVKVAREHAGRKAEFFLCKRPRRDELLAVEVFDFDAATMEALRGDLRRIFEGADPSELVGEATPAADEGGEADGGPGQVVAEDDGVTADGPVEGPADERQCEPGEQPESR